MGSDGAELRSVADAEVSGGERRLKLLFGPLRPEGMALLAVLLASCIARFSTLNEPFTRNHESTASGLMAMAARNMVRYGVAETGLRFVINADKVPPEQFAYYNHHPTLVPALMALSSWLGGTEPWAYRLPAAIFSVLSSGLIFLMLARKFSWPVGFLASVFYSFCPFTWLFANMPDVVGPQLVFFGLATVECYSRWWDLRKKGWLVLAVVCWLACALTDWPAFFLPLLLAAHFVLLNPPRQWWRVIPFGLFCTVVLGCLFWWLMGAGDSDLVNQLLHRTGGASDSGEKVGVAVWWSTGVCYYMATTFTWPLLALAGVYVVRLMVTVWFPWRTPTAHDSTVILLLWGILHVCVGMQSSHQHMWVWTVLLPGVCAAAALGATALLQAIPIRILSLRITTVLLCTALIWFLFTSSLTAKSIRAKGLPNRELITYTLEDMGKMINTFAMPGEGVLTSDLGEAKVGTSEPALWFYADRQIRNGIRSVEALDQAMGPGDYLLPYNYRQTGGPVPWWFVMPAQHHAEFPELAAALDSRYQRWIKDGFLLYYIGPYSGR